MRASKDRNKDGGGLMEFVKRFHLLNPAKCLNPAANSCCKSLKYACHVCIKYLKGVFRTQPSIYKMKLFCQKKFSC